MQKLATIHVSIRGIFRKEKEDMMQSRLWISAVVLLSSISVQTAAASPQEDFAAAGQKWATVFAENSPDAMLPLYAKDAVLWGTLSPTVRSDPAALKAYFVGAFQALPKATVKFGDPRLWQNCCQHGLLYVLLHQRWRNQIDPGPLQLHVCEGRQRLENRRSPFVGGASTA
jgi:hypothetical protein